MIELVPIVEQYFARSNTGSGEYAGHWGLTLEELRSQAFRHHLLGMRQFLFHGFYQTHGHDNDPRKFLNPRFDFPPGLVALATRPPNATWCRWSMRN